MYKTKLNEDGEAERYKTRLVGKGHGQEQGYRLLGGVCSTSKDGYYSYADSSCCSKELEYIPNGCKVRFLAWNLARRVFVQQPGGYVVKGSEDKVYKLRNALYGLKQAPRAWFSGIEDYFIKEGFERSNNKHTLFIKKNSNSERCLVCQYLC